VEDGTTSRGGAAAGALGGAGAGVLTAGGAGAIAVLVSMGGAGAGEAVVVGGACCLLMMAFNASPGLEIWERSILVLISSASARPGRAVRLEVCAGLELRRRARTLSASWSSRELEWLFFSVTPISGSTSRIDLLLTSSSLARSLIRILLIRPFVLRTVSAKSSYQPHGVSLGLSAPTLPGAREFHLLLFLLLGICLLISGSNRLPGRFGRFSLPGVFCGRIRFHNSGDLRCRVVVWSC
jgi:hypothetical protein